ncbi:MAG: carboxymuconolactone decarboxylase family protein, partial [Deltaproteobacteria bacterium]|nr:carboxymuconolactone decarboxylase family protein [Deltaproteobacteria bacterium]
MIPNLMLTMANSHAVLEAYLGFSGALEKGALSARLREQIALVVAETNGSDYCLAAHSAVGKTVGLSDEEVLDSRRGISPDRRVEAVLLFARRLVEKHGKTALEDFNRLRRVGYTDEDIAEIVANVALTIFTNYFNQVAGTVPDFPGIPALQKDLSLTQKLGERGRFAKVSRKR